MLLFRTEDVSGDTFFNPESEDSLNETLVVWIGNDTMHSLYLAPSKSTEPYLIADGIILNATNLGEDVDPELGLLVQHFGLMVGQEPCFLQQVPSLDEYIDIQKNGPGVPEGGTSFCVPPWRHYAIPPEAIGKGVLKNVSRVLVMGWLL